MADSPTISDLSRLALEPAFKLSPSATRSVPAADTEQRIRGILPQLPITRISDLSPLDPLRFPVFVVTTPLARDLTSHAGKGSDASSARVSALMEAIERVSAEQTPQHATVVASYRGLGQSAQRPVIDPSAFELPSDSSYRPDTEISWVESHDLLTDQSVWLPADLAVNPPRDGVLREVDTNGLASGNTLLEAVLHGLCEVIERDALSQLEFTTLFADAHQVRPLVRTVDPETLPPEARTWADSISSCGLSLKIQDLANDIGVPTFRSVLVDPAYPGPDGAVAGYFPGFGCHPNKGVALLRSLSEALQSRVGFIHGGRDSFNALPVGTRRSARLARHQTLFRAPRIAYEELPSLVTLDMRDDLLFLLQRLRQVGIERVLVTDLTRKGWGIPVVRVRVPGLACFLVNRRRVGLRCLRHLI